MHQRTIDKKKFETVFDMVKRKTKKIEILLFVSFLKNSRKFFIRAKPLKMLNKNVVGLVLWLHSNFSEAL